MSLLKTTTIINDPLAGCMDVMKNNENATSFIRSQLLRLRLHYNENTSNKISESIISESGSVLMPVMEYTINELQFELRKARNDFNTMRETVSLNGWAENLMQRFDQDKVLEFISQVKRNRDGRKRN